MHLCKCHLMHNLHTVQEDLRRRNREKKRLADRFRRHIRHEEKNDRDGSKPVAHYFNCPSHSHRNMTICGLSLHQKHRKPQKSLKKIHFSTWHTLSTRNQRTPSRAKLLHIHKSLQLPQFLCSLRRANARNVSFTHLSGGYSTLTNSFDKIRFCFNLLVAQNHSFFIS